MSGSYGNMEFGILKLRNVSRMLIQWSPMKRLNHALKNTEIAIKYVEPQGEEEGS